MAFLVSVDIADPPAAWDALGFTVHGDTAWVDGVAYRLGRPGAAVSAWTLAGLSLDEGPALLDGLTTAVVDDAPGGESPAHPNGVTALDHVVARTPDFDRTVTALEKAGLRVARVRETERVKQAFFRLGTAGGARTILELVGGHAPADGPASFFGLAWTCADLDATAAYLGGRLHAAKPAVQPGRRIATLDGAAGSSVATAFMSPEV